MDIIGKIRLLPITIVATGIMLPVKLGDIWMELDGLINPTPITVARAVAQQPSSQPAPALPPAKAPPADKAPTEPPAAGKGDAPGAAKEGKSSRSIDDPTLLTQAEIDLLQQLAERREILEKRDRELGERGALIDAAESRIGKKIEELKAYQATIEQLIKTYDEQQKQKLDALVKVYTNMKPKDAARIFEQLDMNTLLMVAEQMQSRQLAPIMATMDPSKAKDVTEELARLRNLPKPVLGPSG